MGDWIAWESSFQAIYPSLCVSFWGIYVGRLRVAFLHNCADVALQPRGIVFKDYVMCPMMSHRFFKVTTSYDLNSNFAF